MSMAYRKDVEGEIGSAELPPSNYKDGDGSETANKRTAPPSNATILGRKSKPFPVEHKSFQSDQE